MGRGRISAHPKSICDLTEMLQKNFLHSTEFGVISTPTRGMFCEKLLQRLELALRNSFFLYA